MNVPVVLAVMVPPVLMNSLILHVFVLVDHMATDVSVSCPWLYSINLTQSWMIMCQEVTSR